MELRIIEEAVMLTFHFERIVCSCLVRSSVVGADLDAGRHIDSGRRRLGNTVEQVLCVLK